MRVLIVVGSLARGGAERQAILTCGALHDSGVQARLFVLQPPLDLLSELGDASSMLADDPAVRQRVPEQLAALSRELRSGTVDAVISFLPSAHIRVLLARRSSRVARAVAWIATERGNVRTEQFGAHPVTSGLRLVALREADRVVVNSPALAGNLVTFTGGLAEKLVVVPNVAPPTTESRPEEAHARLRSLIGKELERPLIGAIGSFQPDRNYELLIRTLAEVVRVHPAAHLLVCGRVTGSLFEPSAHRAKTLTNQLGISGNVTFAGDVPTAKDLLPAFDAFVLPSILEGSSNALAEALAAGAAIATTPVGDAESLAGGAARISEGWTPRVLSEAVLDVLREPEIWRARARARGAALASERSSLRMGERWRLVVNEAVRRRREATCAE